MADQWRCFEALGQCGCGKPATGVLRGSQNESYGNYCQKCGEKLVVKSEKERGVITKDENYWVRRIYYTSELRK